MKICFSWWRDRLWGKWFPQTQDLCFNFFLSVSSVAQSCPIFCDPTDCKHARLPCPLPTPGAYSNSCHWVGVNLLLLISSLFFLSNRESTRGFSGGSDGKESTCNSGDLGSVPGLGRFPGEGNGNPLQYSGLEISMDCIVHGVERSWKCLSNFHFHTSQ